MVESRVAALVSEAIDRIDDTLGRHAPRMGARVAAWQRALIRSGDRAEYFTHEFRFPILRLPVWAERHLTGTVDWELQRELIYSTINGYYFVRLIDDVADGHGPGDPALLPAAAFFHTEFLAPYHRLFGPESAFWAPFRDAWLRAAETAIVESEVERFDERAFETIAAQKIGAAEIPIAAVSVRRGRLDALPEWRELIVLLGRHEQMLDDVFDWHRDEEAAKPSYFLAEAERRRGPDRSVAEWVFQEGFEWGLEEVARRRAPIEAWAARTGSAEVAHYAAERAALVAEFGTRFGPALRTFALVAEHFDSDNSTRRTG